MILIDSSLPSGAQETRFRFLDPGTNPSARGGVFDAIGVGVGVAGGGVGAAGDFFMDMSTS